jgi:hypothetical protein
LLLLLHMLLLLLLHMLLLLLLVLLPRLQPVKPQQPCILTLLFAVLLVGRYSNGGGEGASRTLK